MTRATLAAFDGPAGAWWRAALVAGWLVGTAMQLRQPALWAPGAYRHLVAAALLGGAVAALAGRRMRPRARWRIPRAPAGSAGVAAILAMAALGFGGAGWRAESRLSDALSPDWEGRDIEIVGVVDEMPQIAEDGRQFAFAVESARDPGPAGAGDPSASPAAPPRVPTRIRLAWSIDSHEDRLSATPAPALRAGQRWRLTVRLRRPHGAMNPEGFDAELWLFDRGLRATGNVRGPNELVGQTPALIEQARQSIRDRLLMATASGGVEPRVAGALAALAVGDQASVDGEGWDIFRNTGVAHLMSISGLHITMLGWLASGAIGAGWRRAGRAALWWPAPLAARWGGVGVAALYALLAGWGVPAQRTVVMLAGTAVLRGAGLNWPPSLVALAAMVPVTLLDPWALLQPGFWLSFAAVLLLMLSEPARRGADPATVDPVDPVDPVDQVDQVARPGPVDAHPAKPPARRAVVMARRLAGAAAPLGRHLRGGLRAQAVASVGLAPLSLVVFQQVSLVGLLANIVADPWITLVVTPLALLGILLPPAWQAAGVALQPLLTFLAWLDGWPLASVHVAAAPAWGLASGLAGGGLAMLPLPRRLRLLSLPLVLPLLLPFVPRPAVGRFELLAADVGQGSAILVRTRDHLLLFDAGPRLGESADAGERLLLPLLHARGESRIDLLVLSHADTDHVGGAASIIAGLPVAALATSLAPGHPLRAGPIPHAACTAGHSWTWDGVGFRFLHPPPGPPPDGDKSHNAVSCVLRVEGGAGRSALLTGDIEAPQEAALVGAGPAALRSDVLLLPHHGSRTSSTRPFLEAVRPRVAVIQAGYRNRYHHPAPAVLERLAGLGMRVVRTDRCGAWSSLDDQEVCTRTARRRYWHWQPDGD